MKRSMRLFLAAAAAWSIGVAGVAFAAPPGSEGRGGPGDCCKADTERPFQMRGQFAQPWFDKIEGVDFEVTNTESGVIIRVRSADPALVKAVQARLGAMSARFGGGGDPDAPKGPFGPDRSAGCPNQSGGNPGGCAKMKAPCGHSGATPPSAGCGHSAGCQKNPDCPKAKAGCGHGQAGPPSAGCVHSAGCQKQAGCNCDKCPNHGDCQNRGGCPKMRSQCSHGGAASSPASHGHSCGCQRQHGGDCTRMKGGCGHRGAEAPSAGHGRYGGYQRHAKGNCQHGTR